MPRRNSSSGWGVQGVKGWMLAMHSGLVVEVGVFNDETVYHRATLNKTDRATRNSFLEAFFSKVHAATGVPL
jgi:hypothetical protein